MPKPVCRRSLSLRVKGSHARGQWLPLQSKYSLRDAHYGRMRREALRLSLRPGARTLFGTALKARAGRLEDRVQVPQPHCLNPMLQTLKLAESKPVKVLIVQGVIPRKF